jgi:hypothetical protein
MLNLEHVQRITVASERDRAISEVLDRGYHLSDVLLLDTQQQDDVLRVIMGCVSDGGLQRLDPMLARSERIKLRTVDGKPLGRVKLGLKPMSTREARRLHMAGGSEEITREFPAEFEVEPVIAIHLLRTFGWGLIQPRHRNRNAERTGEKDAHGQPVVSRDRWRLVEVGSDFERRAREAGELRGNGEATSPEVPRRRSA